jgi:hypothetical protein
MADRTVNHTDKPDINICTEEPMVSSLLLDPYTIITPIVRTDPTLCL